MPRGREGGRGAANYIHVREAYAGLPLANNAAIVACLANMIKNARALLLLGGEGGKITRRGGRSIPNPSPSPLVSSERLGVDRFFRSVRRIYVAVCMCVCVKRALNVVTRELSRDLSSLSPPSRSRKVRGSN